MASGGMLLAALLITMLHGACGKHRDPKLCDAVRWGDRNETAQLLEGGADPNIVCRQCLFRHCPPFVRPKQTPLHFAAWKGYTDLVQALISHGAQTNKRDALGRTPVHYADLHRHRAILQVLLTPWDYAAWSGHIDEFQALLNQSAEVNKPDNYSMTPLHYAAEQGHTAVVQALLSHGADPGRRNYRGRTALHRAARHNRSAVVEVFVNNSEVDPLARDELMETPADVATPDVADWLSTHGGAEPTPRSMWSWVDVVGRHPGEAAACASVGVLLAGLKTALEWAHSRGVIVAMRDPSPGESVPSVGALRLAAKAIAKEQRCGSLFGPIKLLANSFAVAASLLLVCGPCMWIFRPIYVDMFAGLAFVVPALWVFGWQKLVKFPVLVMATKTAAGRCRAAVTSLLMVFAVATWSDHAGMRNNRLQIYFGWESVECDLEDRLNELGCQMIALHILLGGVLFLATGLWVLGVAITATCCCSLPVASRAAVEKLAREIDGAGAAAELPQLHPKLKPEGLLGIVMKTGFALLDILTDLNTIATFFVTCHFWFAGVLWTVFLAALGSELVKGNIQALPRELKRTLATGVMTERLIDLLDTDKGFEAPFSLGVTVYGMPIIAHNWEIFLTQSFSLFTSTVGIAGFLSNYLTEATLADQPDAGEPTATLSEGYSALPTAGAGEHGEQGP